jgi:hypothetical protein
MGVNAPCGASGGRLLAPGARAGAEAKGARGKRPLWHGRCSSCRTLNACAPVCVTVQVSLQAVKEAVGAVQEVRFVLFQSSLYDEYVQAAERLFAAAGEGAGECKADEALPRTRSL